MKYVIAILLAIVSVNAFGGPASGASAYCEGAFASQTHCTGGASGIEYLLVVLVIIGGGLWAAFKPSKPAEPTPTPAIPAKTNPVPTAEENWRARLQYLANKYPELYAEASDNTPIECYLATDENEEDAYYVFGYMSSDIGDKEAGI